MSGKFHYFDSICNAMTATEIQIPTNHSEQLYSVHITVSFVGFSLKATRIVTIFHWQITFYMQASLFRSFRYEIDSPTWEEKAYIKAISKLTKGFKQAYIYKLIIIFK
jgi:hypothetical protein